MTLARIVENSVGDVAHLVSSGPSAEAFDWSTIKPSDYVLAINFAGLLCPRFNAVAAVDVSVAGTFDMYEPDVTFYTRNKGKALEGFRDVRRIKPWIRGAASSSVAFGLCVLYRLGFRQVVAIGCDLHTSGRYDHARRLVDLGLYGKDEGKDGDKKRAVVEQVAKILFLKVVFFSPTDRRVAL